MKHNFLGNKVGKAKKLKDNLQKWVKIKRHRKQVVIMQIWSKTLTRLRLRITASLNTKYLTINLLWVAGE